MTEQTRDKIEFNGTDYRLGRGQYPLELLLRDDREDHIHSDIWLGLIEIPDEEKIPRPDFTAINKGIVTSCWRGYTGEWVIHNDILCLKDIKGLIDISIDETEYRPESLLHHVFPEHVGLVEARWFTGPLELCSNYFEVGETEGLTLEIDKGLLIAHEKFILVTQIKECLLIEHKKFVSEPREGWMRRFFLWLKTLAQRGTK